MYWLLAAAALFLAFSNGANDNFKGFATVWGSETLTYRSALLLATGGTLAGSLMSLLLAGELVKAFSGAGLVPADIAEAPVFMAAVGAGAGVTVITATRTGFPISTTHALLGAMVGAALALDGAKLNLHHLGERFVLPLLLSPLLAALLGLAAYRVLRRRGRSDDCICLELPAAPLAVQRSDGAAVESAIPLPAIVLATAAACDAQATSTARVSVPRLLDKLHILSGTTICFARSLNDTPKLAALLIGAQVSGLSSMALVAVAMAGGGWLLARRVAETMSLRVNRMDASQGLSANIITAGLVLLASKFGLPVSTTHVAVGSIAGVGMGAGTTNRAVVRNVLLSWVATLPFAAFAAWAFAAVLS